MSVEPMQFLAEAFETARERGVLDIDVGVSGKPRRSGCSFIT